MTFRAPVVALVLCLPAALAGPPTPREFATTAQAERYERLLHELRCVVCQNQSLADSNAPLASDLRQRIHDMIRDGRSDREITEYLVRRYGDFVLYRPPMKPKTYLLWAGPFLLLVLVIAGMASWHRRRRRPAPLSAEDRRRARELLEEGEDGG